MQDDESNLSHGLIEFGEKEINFISRIRKLFPSVEFSECNRCVFAGFKKYDEMITDVKMSGFGYRLMHPLMIVAMMNEISLFLAEFPKELKLQEVSNFMAIIQAEIELINNEDRKLDS
jgi:hypothetical protein